MPARRPQRAERGLPPGCRTSSAAAACRQCSAGSTRTWGSSSRHGSVRQSTDHRQEHPAACPSLFPAHAAAAQPAAPTTPAACPPPPPPTPPTHKRRQAHLDGAAAVAWLLGDVQLHISLASGTVAILSTSNNSNGPRPGSDAVAAVGCLPYDILQQALQAPAAQRPRTATTAARRRGAAPRVGGAGGGGGAAGGAGRRGAAAACTSRAWQGGRVRQ